jgi:hypothetical protein
MTKFSLQISVLSLTVLAANLGAGVFQYATLVTTTKKQERMAYLWVPPQADQVRGVVMGGMTLMEREMAKNPKIREACASQGLGIIFMKTGLKSVDIQDVLDRMAEVSGYQELSVAPVLFVGHSAGGPQARYCAKMYHERCFGLVQFRGADPGDVDNNGKEGIGPGIPALMMIGNFDEFGKIGRDANGVENWEKDRDKLLKFRAEDEENLGSCVIEPGAGHFAWSKKNADYLSLFIKKAAAAKIPESWPIDANKPAKLLELKATDGYCSDPSIKPLGKHAIAPYSKYKGNPKQALWHLDEEIALATANYHKGIELKDQFISWKDDHWVQSGARNFFTDLDWQQDGASFRVHPVYSQTYPVQLKGRGSLWGRAGEPVGNSDVPIQVKAVSGPIVADGHVIRFQHDELAPATETPRISFMAFSVGNAEYRYTERIGMVSDTNVESGQPQKIQFAPIGNLSKDNTGVELSATSSAGLPVKFHVAYGPAVIENGKLKVSELPKRAKLPVEVKVVAWQFGRAIEPKVQRAEPVEQVIQIK